MHGKHILGMQRVCQWLYICMESISKPCGGHVIAHQDHGPMAIMQSIPWLFGGHAKSFMQSIPWLFGGHAKSFMQSIPWPFGGHANSFMQSIPWPFGGHAKSFRQSIPWPFV